MRGFGNVLAVAGSLVGVYAAYLWWVAAETAAGFNVDSLTDDLLLIGRANAQAALASAVSMFLIATGEMFRALFRRWY